MQVSNISPAQNVAMPASPGASPAPDEAVRWQAALNAAQNPPGGDAQAQAEPGQSGQPEPQHGGTGEAETAAARNGAPQHGAAETARQMLRHKNMIAAAERTRAAEEQAKPQYKVQHKSQLATAAINVAQQVQPEQAASLIKAPVRAAAALVPEVANPAMPEAAPAGGMAAMPVSHGGGSVPAKAGHAGGTAGNDAMLSSTGLPQHNVTDTYQAVGAAPGPAAMPAPTIAKVTVPRTVGKSPADAGAGKAMNVTASIASVSNAKARMAAGELRSMQRAGTEEGSGKGATSNAPSAFIAPAIYGGADIQRIAATDGAGKVAAGGTAVPASAKASAAGLAATITALHQSGQASAAFRLDPPGLGALAVHVALGQQGQVNVLFVPSTQAASMALQSGLPGLGQALAQSGLALGQAQVGGQFGQSTGQGAGQDGQPQNRQGGAPVIFGAVEPAASSTQDGGVSAYA